MDVLVILLKQKISSINPNGSGEITEKLKGSHLFIFPAIFQESFFELYVNLLPENFSLVSPVD